MRLFFASFLLGAILVSFESRAMMAPKFERARALAAAIEHLQEISSMLEDPIDKIGYVGDAFRFWAGKCFVPVTLKYLTGGGTAPPGGGTWNATVGRLQCR
jgi:hypothetical protein